MYSRRFDILLGVIGLFLVVAGFYQLYFPKNNNVGVGVGLLEMIENTVKTRDSGHLFWVTPGQGSAVKDNQLIFTARGSRARIDMNDGNIIQVNESSLIKVKTTNLEFIEGEVKAKLAGKDLEIQTKGKTITLKSADAEVSLYQTGENTIIGVNTGDVDILDGEKTIKANSEKLVEVQNKELVLKNKLTIDPIPSAHRIFYTQNSSADIQFGSYEGKILLSADSSFQKAQLLEQDSVSLNPGKYFWRVKAQEAESLVFQFEIQKVSPPKIFRPQNGTVFHKEIPFSLYLQWEDQKLPERLQLKLNDEIQEFNVDSGLHSFNVEKAGLYQWRVGVLLEERNETAWSPWSTFDVVDFASAFPTNLTPVNYEVQTYELEQERVEFKWSYPQDVILSVWKDGKVIFTQNARDHFEWKIPSEGEFTVKVKDAQNPLDIWSNASVISVVDLSQQKNIEIQKIELKRPDQEVHFNWQASGEEYLFELSETQSFQQIILSRKVKDHQTKVSIPKVGDYYWRSRTLVNGKWKASSPKKVIIQPVPAPERPKSLPDLKVPLRIKEVHSIFSIFSNAYANSLGFVKINLPTYEEAKSYRLEIFYDQEMTRKVYEKVSGSPKFLWEEASAGTFYYRYSIIDHWDRESEPSEASLLKVTTEHLTPKAPSQINILENEKELKVVWKTNRLSAFTELEIADNPQFNHSSIVRLSENHYSFAKKEGTVFVRLRSLNDFGKSRWKNKDYQVKVTNSVTDKKIKDNKFFFLYRPSQDKLTFEQGQKGEIDGTNLASVQMRYEGNGRFLKVLNADFSSGKVFDNESYRHYSLEGSLVYLIKNEKWSWGAGPAIKFWQMPQYKVTTKVQGEEKLNTSLGLHGRIMRQYGRDYELGIDQYIYALDVSGFMSELTYRQYLESFSFISGLGFESIKVQEQKRSSIILKLGIGISF